MSVIHVLSAAEAGTILFRRLVIAAVMTDLSLTLSVRSSGLQEAQNQINNLESPKEIVEKLWSMAMRGDLLTDTGWTQASRLFAQPVSAPGNRAIGVMSNQYGVTAAQTEGQSAKVWMQYTKVGEIDSLVRFAPAAPSSTYGTAEEYHLKSGHRHIVVYGPDGKTKLQDREIPESVIWQIEGSLGLPWTTVNTAIRYVLEQRSRATNPTVRRNADQTLAALLMFH